jgi:sugar phosphate permease
VYCVVYVLFGWSSQAWEVWALFALYGLYHGLTEGAEKSLVAEYAEPQRKGEAFGLYHALTGSLALPASLWMGLVWDHLGSRAAFMITGAITLAAVILFRAICRARS